MAYCDKCGAYIPDGQRKCLACGYDPTAEVRAEREKAAAAAYQKEKKAEEERLREERTRAEEERRRKVDEDRRWAEKEYARRRAERVQNERSRWEDAGFIGSTRESGNYRSAAGNKVLAILSYFSFLFILPLIFAGDDKFCRFHGKQGLALFVFGAIASALSSTPFGWIMQIMRIYMIVKGVISAANGRCDPLPFIGKAVDK